MGCHHMWLLLWWCMHMWVGVHQLWVVVDTTSKRSRHRGAVRVLQLSRVWCMELSIASMLTVCLLLLLLLASI